MIYQLYEKHITNAHVPWRVVYSSHDLSLVQSRMEILSLLYAGYYTYEIVKQEK